MLSLLVAAVAACSLARAAGQSVCFEGYVMDSYCIDRGTLLDAPKLQTLQNADKHTIHCLVDVGSCG